MIRRILKYEYNQPKYDSKKVKYAHICLKAALLKSFKSELSFSRNFDENIFIILGNFFSSLGDFC